MCPVGECLHRWVFTAAFWLGFFNSALNPFIYAVFIRDFAHSLQVGLGFLNNLKYFKFIIRNSSDSAHHGLPTAFPGTSSGGSAGDAPRLPFALPSSDCSSSASDGLWLVGTKMKKKIYF
jgi:octopamine receptor